MATKKYNNKRHNRFFYMDYVLENGEKPKSVYLFAKLNGFTEADFMTFRHIESLEKNI
jgi:hypothetical protein